MDSEIDPDAHMHEAITADDVRMRRDNALKNSDWTQVADAPVDAVAWATYRQALRDITDDPAWPFVELPEAPS